MTLIRFLSALFCALCLGPALAHLLELPNKMALSREEYLVVQQIYRGWALLGIPIFAALLATAALAVLRRGQGAPFYFALAAALCIAFSLVVFFSITYPANQATENWTALPTVGWEALRRRWEYSHAAGALLYFIALTSLVLSLLSARRSE